MSIWDAKNVSGAKMENNPVLTFEFKNKKYDNIILLIAVFIQWHV